MRKLRRYDEMKSEIAAVQELIKKKELKKLDLLRRRLPFLPEFQSVSFASASSFLVAKDCGVWF